MDARTLIVAATPDPKIIAIIVVAMIAVLLIAWAVVRNRRTAKLRQRFGPEYDRTLREHGASGAETVLTQREKRVEKFPYANSPSMNGNDLSLTGASSSRGLSRTRGRR